MNHVKALKKIMFFDLSSYGHHATYIQYLVNYLTQNNLNCIAYFIVSPLFLKVHIEVIESVSKVESNPIIFQSIKENEYRNLKHRGSSFNQNVRKLQEWYLFTKYASQLKVDHANLLYLDTCDFPLTLGLPSPCMFSGIYFRPTLHYQEVGGNTNTQKHRLQRAREVIFLERALRHKKIEKIFCLDPYAVDYIQQRFSSSKIKYLVDPVETRDVSHEEILNLRYELKIDSEKKVFLLFGALTERKGVFKLLNAIAHLSEEACRSMCLLLVGDTDQENKAKLRSYVSKIKAKKPIDIIERYTYVNNREIPTFFSMADVILAPYQHHVGMSGILLHAAANKKPVISSNYGLMGLLIDRYNLGTAVNTSNEKEIALALDSYIFQAQFTIWNSEKGKRWSLQNSPQNFAKTIIESSTY